MLRLHRSLDFIPIRPLVRCTLALLLLIGCTGQGQGGQAPVPRTRIDGLEVSVRQAPNTPAALDVINESDGERFTVVASKETELINEVHVVNSNRVALLGGRTDLGHKSTTVVVDLQRPAVLDEIIRRNFSFSPTGRFVAYTDWGPRYDDGTGHLYVVYDLAASPNDNRRFPQITGIPIYALDTLKNKLPESERHALSDKILWLAGSDVVSFGDLYKGRVSLVVVDLRQGVDKQLTFTQPIDPSVLSQSPCASEAYTRGFTVSDAKASAKPGYVTVTLRSPLRTCGEFEIAVPGLQLP